MSVLISSIVLLAQNGNPPGANPLIAFAPWIIIFVLFYLLLMRPERRRRAELERMLNNLKKNDRVVAAGGILGTVVNTSKDSHEVTIKVDESSNTRLRVLRSSISRVLTAEEDGDSPES